MKKQRTRPSVAADGGRAEAKTTNASGFFERSTRCANDIFNKLLEVAFIIDRAQNSVAISRLIAQTALDSLQSCARYLSVVPRSSIGTVGVMTIFRQLSKGE